jgi:hypothetical protein
MIPTISASKVAGLIGLHKFQDQAGVMYDLLCRDKVAKQRVAKLEESANRRPFYKVAEEVLSDTFIKSCIYSGLRACKKTEDVKGALGDVENAAWTLLNLRYTQYPMEVRSMLVQEIRGKVAKQRGLNNENKILNQYEVAHDVKVVERNTKMLKKDFGTFILTGRTDGWVASENRVVDSKDRTRWFPEVPVYDEIQLRVYMHIIECPESELIERFPDGRTRVTKFLNDPEKWEVLQKAIETAVQTMNQALTDDEALKRIVFANTIEANNGSGIQSSSSS